METLNNLNRRHVAQIVRRKMIEKVKPSDKPYDRKKEKNVDKFVLDITN